MTTTAVPLCISGSNYKRLTSVTWPASLARMRVCGCGCASLTPLIRLTPPCLCPLRFDYCKFIELDYVPMEAGYMVSMRPTKGYTSTKSPTKGYNSTKSPDRHGHSVNSPSTPRARFVFEARRLACERELLELPSCECFIVEKNIYISMTTISDMQPPPLPPVPFVCGYPFCLFRGSTSLSQSMAILFF